MLRVVIDPAVPDRASLDNEIARLRGLDVAELRARWHTVFRRRAPSHLPRHLLFRILAYRLQADRLGDLGADIRRLLERIGSGSPDGINRIVADLNRPRTELRPGTLLLAGRHHQGRQDYRARRQDRRQGQWPLSAAQARARPTFRVVRPGVLSENHIRT
jgi:Protein of unknown function (DUF2924)